MLIENNLNLTQNPQTENKEVSFTNKNVDVFQELQEEVDLRLEELIIPYYEKYSDEFLAEILENEFPKLHAEALASAVYDKLNDSMDFLQTFVNEYSVEEHSSFNEHVFIIHAKFLENEEYEKLVILQPLVNQLTK